jgi:hypothetical protein
MIIESSLILEPLKLKDEDTFSEPEKFMVYFFLNNAYTRL